MLAGVAAMTNLEVARHLDEVANLLAEQDANPFRIRAYQDAAESVRRLDRPVSEILDAEGLEGLRVRAGVGWGLAGTIRELAVTGRLPLLDRLRGESDPVALLTTVPGVGRTLAERLHDELGIATLEELEAAAHDGRLARVPGIGTKRLAAIQGSLAARLGRRRPRPPEAAAPPVAELLDVDREYREKAGRGRLRRIAPRRFNPEGDAWLPILHTQRGDREYTALFSNTALAHRLGKTADWVVLYYDGGRGERQCTIVTESLGPLRGKRVVRGRELASVDHYRRSA